ncbi:MAG: hypothetical protein MI866_18115 [Bacteroidales bacterium]|nr:hypothetical protein [Bacteroidales bacterium]
MKKIISFLNIFILGLLVITVNSCKEDDLLIIKEAVMTWENPAELVEGLPLTKEQLNATANVPGTIVYTPELGTVLPLGESQQLLAEFTPRDSKNYKKVSKTVTINIVDRYFPIIIWEDPAVLPEGTPLSEGEDGQLNAEATDAEGNKLEGSFVYDPPAGTVLPLGENQELKVTFTPTAPTHQATSKTVLINVRDVVPLRVLKGSAVFVDHLKLAFDVSDEVGSLGDSPKTGFSVHVKNHTKGIDREFGIADVTFDPANATQLVIELAEEVYADDMITITYNEEGNTILSVDDQILNSFDAERVAIPVAGDDVLAGNSWAGFEGAGGADAGGAAGYWVGGGGYPWMRTTDMFASGVACMEFSGTYDDKVLYGMNFGDNVDTQPGAYEVTHKIYIEAGSDLKTLRTAIARKETGWGDDVDAVWDVENISRGEWVTIKQIINIPVASGDSEKMRYSYYVEAGLNEGAADTQTFYLDDMGLRKVDVAPRP